MAINKLQEEKGIALEDFIKEFTAAPFELFNEERIYWMPSLAGHTTLIEAVKKGVESYLHEKPMGTVLAEATFITEYSKDWVKGSRIPDLMFYMEDRLSEYKKTDADWKKKPYVLVPDLAIEIVSLNDSYSDVNRKVDAYLDDGVKEIWVIDPQAENALVHQKSKTARFSKEESLKSEVLPDFELNLKDVFAAE
jgi:Uma2 family endonuclease